MKQGLMRIAASAAMLLAAAGTALAGTTGAIVGTITDASGGVLPGVTVEATSPALQGTKVAVTGGDGSYRFTLLPPGVYAVKATMSGFRTVEKKAIQVGMDDTVRSDFRLDQAAGTEITVIEETPLIDQRSPKGGANFSEDLFDSLPIQRNYSSIVGITPGASGDGSGTTFYGSSGPENNYIIDGVNTTSIAFGTQGKNLNFDFIQEVEVKTSGYEAEFGRATGGIVNVITKSGGNEFTGDGFGYWSGKKLQAAACETCGTRAGVGEGFDEYDFGGDLGGYLIKDKLWFFAALNPTFRNDFGRTPTEVTVAPTLTPLLPRTPDTLQKTEDENRYYFSGKGTWNINANNNFVLSFFGDPTDEVIQPRLSDAKRDRTDKRGGTDVTAKINSVLSTSLYVDTQAALHQEKSHIVPRDGDFDSQVYYHRLAGIGKNGFGRWQKYDLDRWSARGSLTGFAGDHEFKMGADIEHLIYDARSGYTGGIYNEIRNTAVAKISYFQLFDAEGNPLLVDTLTARTTTTNLAMFVQDKWSIRPNFVLSAGLRWDKQSVNDFEGVTRIRLKDNFAPRFGFSWDPTNRGKLKIYGSAGRFFEAVPLDMNNRSLGAEGNYYNFVNRLTRNPTVFFGPGDVGDRELLIFTLGGEITPVVDDLKGQHLDEISGGFEYEIAPRLAIGVKGIYREIGDVIEDLSVDDGNHYFIGNPGQGQSKTGIDSNGNPVEFPLPERTYKGIELTLNKRLSNRWQVFASYSLGKLEGNYEGLYTASNGQLDPNITSAFDIPTLLPNRFGPLPQDRRHAFKLDGSWESPFKLSLGASLRFQSGKPLNTLGAHPLYGTDEAFMLPRGQVFSQSLLERVWAAAKDAGLLDADADVPTARARTPGLFSVDLNLQYPIRLGNATMHLFVDVFNVFNAQRATGYDETFTQDDVDVASTLGKSEEEILFSGTELRFTPYADYLRPTSFQSPRRARFGAKLSF